MTHSFPTRRSSDLAITSTGAAGPEGVSMRFLSAFVVTLLAATAAQAHTRAPIGFGGGTGGFAVGFLHPPGGLDHVLAMVGVGLFACFLGGRPLWLAPLAFLALVDDRKERRE